jgi:pantoate--beta-alanine ligase
VEPLKKVCKGNYYLSKEGKTYYHPVSNPFRMILFRQAVELQLYIAAQKQNGARIGFVPTMGALHAGHISLIDKCKLENDCTVCSIFVNPTQFNDPKDFERYPVTIEADIRLLEKAGADVLFLPSVAEIYPGGVQTTQHYDLGYLETLLEGRYRPGHFQGVCQVVHRLFDIVQPHNAFFGQKDYQQCMVIKKLAALIASSIHIHICPTLREPDGLAMSSRNMRLSDQARRDATAIYRALSGIKNKLQPGKLEPLADAAKAALEAQGFRVDYVSVADALTLEPVADWDGQRPLVALAAAFLGEIRLIDNLVLT